MRVIRQNGTMYLDSIDDHYTASVTESAIRKSNASEFSGLHCELELNDVTSADTLQAALMTVEANEDFTEAILRFYDDSRLCFCHRVGERWAKAVGPEQRETEKGLATEFLFAITIFRLNAKHLDIQFRDNSRWDTLFKKGDESHR